MNLINIEDKNNVPPIKYPITINKEDALNISEFKTRYVNFGLNPGIKYSTDGYPDPFDAECEGIKKINQLGDLYKIIKEKDGSSKIEFLPKMVEILKDFRKPWINPGTGEIYCDLVDSIFRYSHKRIPEELQEEHKKIKKSGSKSKELNWLIENNLFNKFFYGQMLSTGENIFCGQPYEKYLDKNQDSKLMVSALFNNKLDSERHIINLKTINVGDVEKKKIDKAMTILFSFVDLILEKEGSETITRKSLMSYKVKPSFRPIELELDFVEEINMLLDEMMIRSEDKISKVDKKLAKLRLCKGEKLTPYKFYNVIKSTLLKLYLHSSKTMPVIPLDIDLNNNVGGYFSLLLLQELMKEFKCYFVKNKLSYKGEEKLFHGSLYIILDGRYKREDIDFIAKLFKIIGLNDLNHKYFVAKNLFNYELFNLYESTSNRCIFDTMKDPNSLLYKIIEEVIENHYAIKELNLCIEDEQEDIFGNKILSIKNSINKIYEKFSLLKNLNKENQYFFFLDNYSFYHKFVLKDDNYKITNKITYREKDGTIHTVEIDKINKKYFDDRTEYWINGDLINLDEIISKEGTSCKENEKEYFNNTACYGRLKKLGYNVNMINLKGIEKVQGTSFIEVEDYRTKKENEKEILEDNVGYQEITDFIQNSNGKCKKRTIKDLEKFNVKLYSRRKTNLYWFARKCGSCRKLNIEELDFINYILNNWWIRNDDNKYDNESLREIIQSGWKDGREFYENTVSRPYNDYQVFLSGINSKINSIKRDLDITIKCLYNREDIRALKRQIRARRKSDPYLWLMVELFETRFKNCKELFIKTFEKTIDFSTLNKKEREKLREKIIKESESLEIYVNNQLNINNTKTTAFIISFCKFINKIISKNWSNWEKQIIYQKELIRFKYKHKNSVVVA